MPVTHTMMLHSGIHWPDITDPSLWPMAIQHAIFLYNCMPSTDTGVSPSDLFTQMRWPEHHFHDCHVWGSPTYILEKMISDGKILPQWKPCSHQCMFMGLSPQHATSTPLVLNLTTRAITPQYHVVLDNWFVTIPVTSQAQNDILSQNVWTTMFGNASNFLHSPGYPEDENDDATNWYSMTNVTTHYKLTENVDKVSSALQDRSPAVPLSILSTNPLHFPAVSPTAPMPVCSSCPSLQSLQ